MLPNAAHAAMKSDASLQGFTPSHNRQFLFDARTV
jgi:hypothetical protein